MWTSATVSRRIIGGVVIAAIAALVIAGSSGLSGGGGRVADAAVAGPSAIRYVTIFQAPDESRARDLSIENRAIALVNGTPEGERIGFAFRDFNRAPVVNALIAAHARGVAVRGVIDGGEQNRPALVPLKTALGADLVYCGSDVGFALHSCLANDPKYSEDGKSLQHNKFMTFSKLSDGREHVVLEMSMNFLTPSQLTYFNDAVEITGDVALHGAYEQYVRDMMEQAGKRTNDRYSGFVVSGDDGRNTMFPSPRAQPDLDSEDTIVDRMNEIDCSDGGTIRAANQAFRSERAVIMRKLAQLKQQGCEVEVIFTNADADIISGLASAGIQTTPFWWSEQPGLAHVRVHNKFWLVDAKAKASGERSKIAYVGSSNWRADQQYSDDMLLRVLDDGVYDAYNAYWNLIKARAFTDLPLTNDDDLMPRSAVTVSPAPTADGWYRGDVTVRIAASDGHVPNVTSGLDRLHIELSGAQTYSSDVVPPDPRRPAVEELVISAEGETSVSYHAVDRAGNREERSIEIRIDKTAPAIAMGGLLAGRCELWPPNAKMRPVGIISATDAGSGLRGNAIEITVTGESSPDDTHVVATGPQASVNLRAIKSSRAEPRIYAVTGTARDRAGNTAGNTATCVVPHSQGASK